MYAQSHDMIAVIRVTKKYNWWCKLTFVRNRVRPVRIDMASIFTINTDDQKAYELKTSLSKEIYCVNDMMLFYSDRFLLIINGIHLINTEQTDELNDTRDSTALLRILLR